MAKKNFSSDNSTSLTNQQPVPERRRTARATTRNTATTPDAITAEPDGTTAAARDVASDMARQGDDSTSSPTYEQIAEAAYHRYLQRGGQHGHDFDDWIDAERSLRSR